MSPTSKFQYAQLPVFHYQVWDKDSLNFSNVPIIPPNAKPPVIDDDNADFDYWKGVASDDNIEDDGGGNGDESSGHDPDNHDEQQPGKHLIYTQDTR